MIVDVWFEVVGVLLIVMALGGTLFRRLPLTTAILYMAVGVLLGPSILGLIRFDPFRYSGALERLTEAAVVISLFTAGLKLRTPFSDKRWIPPVRLATLTMVVSIGLVTLLGIYLLGLPVGAAVLLGSIMAPTDPVLASDVQVAHAGDRSSLRFGLTGEAGLNDGTTLPFFLLGMGLLGQHELGAYGLRWLGVDLLWSIAAGLGVGWLLGQGVGRLTVWLRGRSEEDVGYEDLLSLGLIALTYGAALLLHANGFLAVFAAGLGVRVVEMRHTGTHAEPARVLHEAASNAEAPGTEALATTPETAPAYLAHAVLGFSEQAERILEAAVVLVLGGLLTYATFTRPVGLFVLAMLLVVRPLSVYLTYGGAGSRRELRPYIAWFGIRGIGSLFYLFYAVDHGLPEELGPRLLGIVLAMVAASTIVHGVSVTPLMNLYGRTRKTRASRSAERADA